MSGESKKEHGALYLYEGRDILRLDSSEVPIQMSYKEREELDSVSEDTGVLLKTRN